VPTAPWTATVKCGDGQWFKLGVALRCFSMSQPDMSHVTAPFSIATAGPAAFALAQVQLATVADVTTACPS